MVTNIYGKLEVGMVPKSDQHRGIGWASKVLIRLWFGKKLATNRKCQRLWWPIGFWMLYLEGVGEKGGVLGRERINVRA